MHTKFLFEILKGRDHSKDLGVNGRIILKWILGKWCVRCGLNSSGSEKGLVAGSCQHGNEPTIFMKGGKHLD
jgi:hypothetical protein